MSQTQTPGEIVLAAVVSRPGSTAQEILDLVKPQMPGISLGSVVGILSTAVSRDQLRTEGAPGDRRYFQTPARRRWTVRVGTTGSGRGLFEVYAATMEEARASVVKSAEESGDLYLRALVAKGFTVHAETKAMFQFQVFSWNKWAERFPAPDFPRELANA